MPADSANNENSNEPGDNKATITLELVDYGDSENVNKSGYTGYLCD